MTFLPDCWLFQFSSSCVHGDRLSKVGKLGENAENINPEPTESGNERVAQPEPSLPPAETTEIPESSEAPKPAKKPRSRAKISKKARADAAAPPGGEAPAGPTPPAIEGETALAVADAPALLEAPAEAPLTDLQRRALIAEEDLSRAAPEGDASAYLEQMQSEIEGLEGTEGLQELERARDQINQEAERFRMERDELNARTKQLAAKRDELNAQVSDRVAKAAEHRELRNKLNEEVKSSKVGRDQLNIKANELGEVASKIKRDRHQDVAVPIPRLKEEKRALEFRYQTQPTTPAKEKEMVAELRRLEREIKAAEALMEKDREVYDSVGAARQAKQEAEAQHRKLSDLARQAQAAHEAMMKLYEEADALRKQADDAQQEFIANKKEADYNHFSHIDMIKKVKDYDKVVSGIRRRRREIRRAESDRRQEKKTDSMMEKFKKGEKLSTEDLLAMQLRGG